MCAACTLCAAVCAACTMAECRRLLSQAVSGRSSLPIPGGSRPRVQRLNPHQGSTTANVLRPAFPLPAQLCHRTELTDFSQKFPSFLRFLSLCLASIPILSDRLFYAASASRSERGGGSKIHTAWGAGCLKRKNRQIASSINQCWEIKSKVLYNIQHVFLVPDLSKRCSISNDRCQFDFILVPSL